MIDRERFQQSPCYICGYNGPGYYQPRNHPCSKDYHVVSAPAAEVGRDFDIWFDSKYYTIDPIARETAHQSWLAGREAEKEAMLKTGTLFGEPFSSWQLIRYELMSRFYDKWNKPKEWPSGVMDRKWAEKIVEALTAHGWLLPTIRKQSKQEVADIIERVGGEDALQQERIRCGKIVENEPAIGVTGWVEEVGSFLGSKPGYCRHDQRDLNDFLAANRMQLTEDSCTLTGMTALDERDVYESISRFWSHWSDSEEAERAREIYYPDDYEGFSRVFTKAYVMDNTTTINKEAE